MRHNPTPAEKHLYDHLIKAGFTVRHQQPLCGYIVDFFFPVARVCVEVDGAGHFTPKGKVYDRQRTAVLMEQGYSVLRFTNSKVISDVDGCLDDILREIRRRRAPSRKAG